MKARVSHLLIGVAVLLIIVGIISLFFTVPMRPKSFEQRQLYDSATYQNLAKTGVATKAIVTAVIPDKDSITNLMVKFFLQDGTRVEAYIPLTKVTYSEADLVNVVYDLNNPNSARIAPAEEQTLNWPLFGWFISIGIILFWLGSVRRKVSGGLE